MNWDHTKTLYKRKCRINNVSMYMYTFLFSIIFLLSLISYDLYYLYFALELVKACFGINVDCLIYNLNFSEVFNLS